MTIHDAINVIPYIIMIMTFWDFTIHVIDKRDRKYRLIYQWNNVWAIKLIKSNSFLSYYYPHFWGKKPVTDKQAWKRYDYFWLIYWGSATVLLFIYIIFR